MSGPTVEQVKAAAPQFLARLADPDERRCREWTGARDKEGYGRLKIGRAQMKAHRVAYMIAHGVDPAGLYVCHSCDNPACCAPDHLWLGTNRENQIDAVDKGRRPIIRHKGENNPRAKLTERQAREVIALITSGKQNVEIATIYGVDHATVSAIRRGKSWPDLPRPQNDNFERYASLRA